MSYKQHLIQNDYYFSLVLLHILIGVVLFVFEPLSKLYFILLMFYFTIRIIVLPQQQKTREIFFACAYFSGVEVLFRMTKGGLSYEASKYLVIVFMLMGMLYKGLSGRGYPYFFYLIALVPSIVVASITLTFDANFRTNIAFVLSGPVCLGIAALFCYDRKISKTELLEIVKYIALPCITTTMYLFLYNPTIRDTLSGTASNAATSGGFGPNQVSTVLGLGMFAMVVRLFMQSPTLFLKLVNVFILGAMTFRAIVTFSRGGVFAAAIVVIAFMATLYVRSTWRVRQQMIGVTVLLGIALTLTWVISSNQTMGLIDKRYANQNAQGIEKEDVTTGRLDLFMQEIDGFVNNPFLGIGASRIKDIRVELYNNHLPSHNEVGRLLSEHGILGLIIILILIIKPLVYRTQHKGNFLFYAFFCFWFATINHSGMRIAAPALLYAFCLLKVTNDAPSLYRKQLKK